MARNFSLDALKQHFAASAPQNNQQNNNNYYPFWNMDAGDSAVVRFLPDKNMDNPWFLLEKAHHELIIGGEKKKVPCLKNYNNEDCPICKMSQQFYKNEGKDTVTGKQLYKKRQYLGQIYVVDDPLPIDKELGKNLDGEVRLVSLGQKIYESIKDAVETGELDSAPHSYEEGTNFIIRKTMNGVYADYSRSRFDKRPTPLPDNLVDELEDKLVDLTTLLPTKPEYDYLVEQLNLHLNGGDAPVTQSAPAQSYDTPKAAPAQTYDAPPTATIKATPAPVALDEDDESAAVLAQLRARKNTIK